jgi:20S proteasome subunit beta 5
MNAFVSRFSTTGADAELRKVKEAAAEDGEFSDASWGSEAGFGTLAKGVPAFSVPAVHDVSSVQNARN